MTSSDRPSLQRQYSIPDAEWTRVRDHFTHEKFARGDLAVRPGDRSRRVGFIATGLFRIFQLESDGRESTKAFRAEGQWIAPYAEILRGEPSRSTLQAIEDSEVLWIAYDHLDGLARESLYWSELLRRIAETHYLLKETREWEFLALDARERLSRFRQNFEHHGRVPRYMIASYLGITAVALSRISRLARRK